MLCPAGDPLEYAADSQGARRAGSALLVRCAAYVPALQYLMRRCAAGERDQREAPGWECSGEFGPKAPRQCPAKDANPEPTD